MTNLNISLPEAMKEFIEDEVSTGRYSTPSEFVRELVREAQNKKTENRQERLIEALLSGQSVEGDPALADLYRRARDRIDQKLLAATKSPARDGAEVMKRLRDKNRGRSKKRA